jgi:hypothetical protein
MRGMVTEEDQDRLLVITVINRGTRL